MCTLEDCLASLGVKHIWRDHSLHGSLLLLTVNTFSGKKQRVEKQACLPEIIPGVFVPPEPCFSFLEGAGAKAPANPSCSSRFPAPEAGRLPG